MITDEHGRAVVEGFSCHCPVGLYIGAGIVIGVVVAVMLLVLWAATSPREDEHNHDGETTAPTIPGQSRQLKNVRQDSGEARQDSEALKTRKKNEGQDSESARQDSGEARQDSGEARQDSQTLQERVLRAGLSEGTLGVAALWRRFRDDDSVTKAQLEQVLADLEGEIWKAPDGVQYKVTKADYERRKGRELVRI